MKLDFIDNGNEFDFGRTSEDYAKFRDIYPKNMYDKLIVFGIGKKGQKILDLGSGTAAVLKNSDTAILIGQRTDLILKLYIHMMLVLNFQRKNGLEE